MIGLDPHTRNELSSVVTMLPSSMHVTIYRSKGDAVTLATTIMYKHELQ